MILWTIELNYVTRLKGHLKTHCYVWFLFILFLSGSLDSGDLLVLLCLVNRHGQSISNVNLGHSVQERPQWTAWKHLGESHKDAEEGLEYRITEPWLGLDDLWQCLPTLKVLWFSAAFFPFLSAPGGALSQISHGKVTPGSALLVLPVWAWLTLELERSIGEVWGGYREA